MGSQELVQHKAMVVMQSCSPADAWIPRANLVLVTSQTPVTERVELWEGDLAIYDLRLPTISFCKSKVGKYATVSLANGPLDSLRHQ